MSARDRSGADRESAGGARPPKPETTGPGQWFLRFGPGPEWSIHQLFLAVTAVAGVVLYLVALSGAAGGFDSGWWLLVAVPLLTWPLSNSVATLVLWFVLILVWLNLTSAGSFSWWALLGAVGITISHAATALAASAPPWALIGRATARDWVRAVGIAILAAVVVAALAALLLGRAGGLSPAAYVIGLAGVAGGVWALRSNPPEQE